MNDGIDTGAIISVEVFDFDWRNETGYSLKQKTFDLMRKQYVKVIQAVLEDGILQAEEQNLHEGKYISKCDMLDAMRIYPGDDIDAKIQAFWFPPHEGAYIELGGKKYTLVNEVVLNQITD